jgi:predicted RNA-binding protein
MNYYLGKCTELNLLLCIQNGLWAQNVNRMKSWKPKDRLILYTENGIAGIFEVTSSQFTDNTKIWTDKAYPYRVNINPLKLTHPENRISLKEHGIDKEMMDLYGAAWGMSIVRNLTPIDAKVGERIESLIQAQPPYDPVPTIEDDIKRLAGSTEEPKKTKKPKKEEPTSVPSPDDKSLHNSLIEMIAQIGKWESRYAETEYQIGNLGRLDVVWKRIKTGTVAPFSLVVQLLLSLK